MKVDLTTVTDAASRFWRSRVGRVRTSTVVLIIAFVALSWVHETYAPEPAATPDPSQVVPPGFVPDPDYTWVPRTNVSPPRTTVTTTTPTTTPETTTTAPEETTTSPTETTSPTSPTSPATTTPMSPGPQSTVIDPDGPGVLPPITLPALPGATPNPPADQSQPGQEPAAPALPR